MSEEDPNHPTWAVLCHVRNVGEYLKTFDVQWAHRKRIAAEIELAP